MYAGKNSYVPTPATKHGYTKRGEGYYTDSDSDEDETNSEKSFNPNESENAYDNNNRLPYQTNNSLTREMTPPEEFLEVLPNEQKLDDELKEMLKAINKKASGYFTRENLLAIRERTVNPSKNIHIKACPELSKDRPFPTEVQIQEKMKKYRLYKQLEESDEEASVGLTLKQPLTFFAKNSEYADMLKNPEDFTLSPTPATLSRSESKLLTCTFQAAQSSKVDSNLLHQSDVRPFHQRQFKANPSEVHPFMNNNLPSGSYRPSFNTRMVREDLPQTSASSFSNRIFINSRFSKTRAARPKTSNNGLKYNRTTFQSNQK